MKDLGASKNNLQGKSSMLDSLSATVMLDRRLTTFTTNNKKQSEDNLISIDNEDESMTQSVLEKIEDKNRSDSSGYSGKGGGVAQAESQLNKENMLYNQDD